MLRIQLEEDRPGYAKFTATKWSGSTEVENCSTAKSGWLLF